MLSSIETAGSRMPNQRKKGKWQLTVWLNDSERIVLDKAIELKACSNMSDFVKQAIAWEKKRQEGIK